MYISSGKTTEAREADFYQGIIVNGAIEILGTEARITSVLGIKSIGFKVSAYIVGI